MGIVREGLVMLVAAVAMMSANMRAASRPPRIAADAEEGADARCLQRLQRQQVVLDAFDAAALEAGAGGLHAACVHLQSNLAALAAAPALARAREIALIDQWPDLVDDYIRGEDVATVVDALMELTIHPAWPCQLGLLDSALMRGQLHSFGAAAFSLPEIETYAPLLPEPVDEPQAASAPQAGTEDLELPLVVSLEDALGRLSRAIEQIALGEAQAPGVGAMQNCLDAAQLAVDSAAQAQSLAWTDVLGHLQANLFMVGEALDSGEAVALEPGLALALIDIPQIALAMLAEPSDASLCDALLDSLASEAWPQPLPASEHHAVRSAFGLTPSAASNPIQINETPDAELAATVDTPAPLAQDSADSPLLAPQDNPGEAVAAAAQCERCDGENLAVLSQEFGGFALALDAEMEDARSEHPAGPRGEALARYCEMVERVGETCASVGLLSLCEVFAQIAARAGQAAGSGFTDAHCLWLRTLVQHVRAYLAAPDDPSCCAAMIEVLADGSWPPALPGPDAARLEAALAAVRIYTDQSLRPQRVREASDADVSLAVPRDINPELLDGLLAELPLQSADFAGAMERVVSGQGSLYDIEVAKRAAHTLKGAGNTVGVRGIASLTHHLEDVLIALTRHGAMPSRELTQVLVRAADCLEAMSEALQGVANAPTDAKQVLQQVLDWANRFDELGAEAMASSTPASGVATAVPAAPADAASLDAPGAMPSAAEPELSGAEAAADATSAGGAPQPMLRVPAALVDELLRLVGETMIANTQIKEQLRKTNEHVQAVTHQNLTLQQLTGDLETLVDIRGMTGMGGKAERHGTALDSLEFERFNELHTVTRRLVEAATDSREMSAASEERLKALGELIETQGRLHAENQQAVVGTRMVPVSGVVSRLQRSVRQTSRLLDKPVELEVRGDQTQLDVHILNELLDPLMHMLRNAVDHGIESAAVRAGNGKAASGRIELSFLREGASVVVRCSDDGAGLDLARIRAKALERGLIHGAQNLSDDELARLVLLPGFSTRDASTEVSGRGIGMDAVYSRVLLLKGSLRLVNRPGRGLSVELRVPTSLMTTHGLLVRVNDQVIAMTSFGIEAIQHVMTTQLDKHGNQDIYMDGAKANQVLPLARLLGQTDSAAHLARGWFPALIVQTDAGHRRAVRVDDVLDSQELVVKNLGKYVPHPPGVVGVTILGDGSIAPVLDLPQLLRETSDAVGADGRRARGTAATSTPSRIEARKSALVVDDSLSARRAAAQVMRDAGFEVRTAIDGMEAAALMEKMLPDLVVVDMEMPRMNGLELTTHIRTRDATRHIPVIMVTSRSTDKHRQMADSAGVDVYLTKPFVDEELERHAHRLTSRAKAA